MSDTNPPSILMVLTAVADGEVIRNGVAIGDGKEES